jgi:hypothetical protein
MARLLLMPLALLILSLVIFLIIRLITMLSLSNSKNIELFDRKESSGTLDQLKAELLNSLSDLRNIQFESIAKINYKKITALKILKPEPVQCQFAFKSHKISIKGDAGKLLIDYDNKSKEEISRDNSWLDFWLGLANIEETLKMLTDSGLTVAIGSSGLYQQRNYTEIIVTSHLLPDIANQAYKKCAPILSKAYGKNILAPDITVRNFFMRILVNGLTNLPDFLEVRYALFHQDKFICDYFENMTLRY